MKLRDIARLANVSVSTVSKAFNNAPDISEETRTRVLNVAKEQGCFGKYYNGKYKNRTVALLMPELRSDFYYRYAERLQAIADSESAVLLISSYDFNSEKQLELIDYYADHLCVDGIIAFSINTPLPKNYELPIINFGGGSTLRGTVDCISSDISHAILSATEELARLGHRDIAFIGEGLTKSKELLFCSAAAACKLKIPDFRLITSDYRYEKAGEQGVALLLERGAPTAIICAYDDIAIGAIRALAEHGLSVPEDVSVIGMDNIRVSKYSDAPLSTIESGCDEMCVAAWDLLKKKLDNKFYRLPRNITVTGRYISRGTTGPKKA